MGRPKTLRSAAASRTSPARTRASLKAPFCPGAGKPLFPASRAARTGHPKRPPFLKALIPEPIPRRNVCEPPCKRTRRISRGLFRKTPFRPAGRRKGGVPACVPAKQTRTPPAAQSAAGARAPALRLFRNCRENPAPKHQPLSRVVTITHNERPLPGNTPAPNPARRVTISPAACAPLPSGDEKTSFRQNRAAPRAVITPVLRFYFKTGGISFAVPPPSPA